MLASQDALRRPPDGESLKGDRLARAGSFNLRFTRVSRSAKLDVAAAGRTAAIAINRRRLPFAFAIGAAILAALVRRTVASGMSAFLFLVSHVLYSP
jgi:hypothetical protein